MFDFRLKRGVFIVSSLFYIQISGKQYILYPMYMARERKSRIFIFKLGKD